MAASPYDNLYAMNDEMTGLSPRPGGWTLEDMSVPIGPKYLPPEASKFPTPTLGPNPKEWAKIKAQLDARSAKRGRLKKTIPDEITKAAKEMTPAEAKYDPKTDATSQAALNLAHENVPPIPLEGAGMRAPAGMEDSAMEALNAAYARPANVGLKDLAAFVDAQTGSKFLNAHMNDQSPSEQHQEYAKQRLVLEHITSERMKALMAAKSAHGLTENNVLTQLGRTDREFAARGQKIIDGLNKTGDSMSQAMAAVRSGTVGEIKGALANIARAVGGDMGRISNAEDLRQYIPTLGDDARSVYSYLFTTPDTTQATPQMRNLLWKRISLATENYASGAKEKVDALEKDFKARPQLPGIGWDIDKKIGTYRDAANAITKRMTTPSGGSAPPWAKSKAKAAKDMTAEELKAYAKEHGL